MKMVGNIFITLGVVLVSIFGYQLYQNESAQQQSLLEAEQRINSSMKKERPEPQGEEEIHAPEIFTAEHGEAFATLEIPKLDRTLPIVAGTDADSLQKGIGHLSNSLFPGQNEQIVLSGHRDTVFRNFGEIEIGDQFILTMPYGSYTYEIKETEIVPEDDTSVIREMGEEVLVVTTCYPFHYVGNAPDRFVTYAYPVDKSHD